MDGSRNGQVVLCHFKPSSRIDYQSIIPKSDFLAYHNGVQELKAHLWTFMPPGPHLVKCFLHTLMRAKGGLLYDKPGGD